MKAGEIIGMRADIAGRAAGARLRRIGAPGGLLLAGLLDGSVSQSCGYSACTSADVAEIAVGDHLARLPDHRIAGVIVRQHEERVALVGDLLQLLGVGKVGGQRLVADDMDAAASGIPWRHRSAHGSA